MSIEGNIYKSLEKKYNIKSDNKDQKIFVDKKVLNEGIASDIANANISAGEVEDMLDTGEIEKTTEEAIDEFYELIRKDVPYEEAKNMVLGKENSDLQESLLKEEGEKKMSEPKKRGWDPDEHLKKVCEYYRNWAGFGKDEVLTEEMLQYEDWRLKRVSALKNTPVKKIKEELLKQNKD